MSSEKSPPAEQKFLTNSMASFLQIGAVVVMLYWCYTIVSPFQSIIIWSLIISVALYPTFVALSARLGGRQKLSAAIIVVIGLAVIVVPVWLMTDSAIGGLQSVAAQLEECAVGISKFHEAAEPGFHVLATHDDGSHKQGNTGELARTFTIASEANGFDAVGR